MINKPDHYPDVDPWKLQEHMKSFGDAYIDARRCDAMKYVFRDKDRLKDLIKARNCIDAAIKRLEATSAQEKSLFEVGEIVNYKGGLAEWKIASIEGDAAKIHCLDAGIAIGGFVKLENLSKITCITSDKE